MSLSKSRRRFSRDSDDHNGFGPRFDLEWDVGGTGKTVIRAGGGTIDEQLTFDVFNEVVTPCPIDFAR
jgi:hypothetical protein